MFVDSVIMYNKRSHDNTICSVLIASCANFTFLRFALLQVCVSASTIVLYAIIGLLTLHICSCLYIYILRLCFKTVNINLSDVNGNIIIQATLATSPLESDWFKVYELVADSNANANSSMYTNIEGSYVYMRAKVEDFSQGVVNFVKLSY